jgi:alkylation response protein AidB-like acyl-CoA dehydrogenase
VLSGKKIILPAWREEIGEAWTCNRVHVVDGKITGRKILVPTAAAADAFVVTTPEGAAIVERGGPGVEITLSKSQDGSYFGTIDFANTPCTAIGGNIALAMNELALAHGAYLLGAAERAFEITMEYLGIREQFGRLIGTFQVLQHRSADAKIQLALSRAVLDEAVVSVAANRSAIEQTKCVARALARISDTAMLIARESVQMHGAIGVTDEHDIGLYCRKILSIYNQFGSASTNRHRFLDVLRSEDGM